MQVSPTTTTGDPYLTTSGTGISTSITYDPSSGLSTAVSGSPYYTISTPISTAHTISFPTASFNPPNVDEVVKAIDKAKVELLEDVIAQMNDCDNAADMVRLIVRLEKRLDSLKRGNKNETE